MMYTNTVGLTYGVASIHPLVPWEPKPYLSVGYGMLTHGYRNFNKAAQLWLHDNVPEDDYKFFGGNRLIHFRNESHLLLFKLTFEGLDFS